jgi:large subunit ribosomal protein L25
LFSEENRMSKVLAAQVRVDFNKGANNRLRKLGFIPAVVYGHKQNLHVSIGAHEFATKFRHITESEIINLKVGSSEHSVLIKDYQRNILRNEVLHLDFYEVSSDQLLRTRVPVRIVGTPVGVREGGILEHTIHEFDVECLPAKLPDHFEVDVTSLVVGHVIHVRDVPVPEGVRILNNPDQVVAGITHARVEVAAPAAEVAAVAEPVAAAAPKAAPAK